MEVLGKILFLSSFFIPLLFQILFGSGVIPVSRKMKFWHICVISVVLLVTTYFIYFNAMSNGLKKMGVRDGLPFVFLLMIESIMVVAVALTILIQILVKYFKNRKKVTTTAVIEN